MKWFGDWSGPYCEPDRRITTPIGFTCVWCGERVERNDNGVLLSEWREDQPMQILHRECFRRMVLGSIAHLERRCSCCVPGATETDPPGVTKRAAAKLVDAWAERRRGGQKNPEEVTCTVYGGQP